jgi:hypothetical protein
MLSFYWHFVRSRYAEALAGLRLEGSRRRSHELWALYRMGLYGTVARSCITDRRWPGPFASSVSLAACGRIDEAADLARWLVKQRCLGRRQAELADALAPFAPDLGLELIAGVRAPVTLQAALLLRAGRSADALAALARQEDRKNRHYPERHLLMSNGSPGSPLTQLDRLNAYLKAFDLPPVALRDVERAPSPGNLKSAVSLPSVRGPLVSILMTAYRAEDSIRSAITSVLEQTYRDIELIVVDDASDDRTGEVVQQIACDDDRVRYIRLRSNVGTYAAKNIGLRYAKGEFITCHDADDWSHPLKIEYQVRPLLEDRRLVGTSSHWVRMQDDGLYYARSVHPLMRFNPSSPLFRRELVLGRMGGWDWVRTGADSEFAARLKLVFGRSAVRRVPLPLAFGSHRPGSLMTSADTGYGPVGIPPARLAYWESWNHWHISELRAGRRPRMPDNLLAERLFAAPEKIVVPRNNIAECLEA